MKEHDKDCRVGQVLEQGFQEECSCEPAPSPATPEAEGEEVTMLMSLLNRAHRDTVYENVVRRIPADIEAMAATLAPPPAAQEQKPVAWLIQGHPPKDDELVFNEWYQALSNKPAAIPLVFASPIPAMGKADGVFISIDDYHPNPAHELAIHRNDCGVFQAFYSKHAGGGLGPKSCLICGKSMIEQAIGIQHMELEDIVVCSTCTRLARIPDGEPFGHVHLHALSWVPHECWLKMPKMEKEWYPIPIGKFVDTRSIAPAVAVGETK